MNFPEYLTREIAQTSYSFDEIIFTTTTIIITIIIIIITNLRF